MIESNFSSVVAACDACLHHTAARYVWRLSPSRASVGIRRAVVPLAVVSGFPFLERCYQFV